MAASRQSAHAALGERSAGRDRVHGVIPDPAAAPEAPLTISQLTDLWQVRDEFTSFMLSYKFGIDELMTKINILKEEFSFRHDYSPIEHVSSRLKSPESLIAKAQRKGLTPSFDAIRENVHDIAGVRVTCSFIADAYKIFDMIANQQDVTVIQVRDYIKEPKPNGYKSLHAIIEVPVFMSDHVRPVKVELQIRTIAMDFWASLEHKIYYKYNRQVPDKLLQELRDAADTANKLDLKMEHLHDWVVALDGDRAV
jgi:putative GTP pyrophosphokinase